MAKNNNYSRTCSYCGSLDSLYKNGRNKSGTQQYKCRECNKKTTVTNDLRHYHSMFIHFMTWLLGNYSVSAYVKLFLDCSRETFKRHTRWCWLVEPCLKKVVSDVDYVQVDGIYIGNRKKTQQCIITAIDQNSFLIGFVVADSENSEAYLELFKQFPIPRVIICDGGTGLYKAIRTLSKNNATWKKIRIQRCLVHIQRGTRKYLTLNPQSSAGQDLKKLAQKLLKIKTGEQAQKWVQSLKTWRKTHDTFLAETSMRIDKTTGKIRQYPTHERILQAYNLMNNRLLRGEMFTYLEYKNCDSTTNKIEGAINAKIRRLLDHHRGLNLGRQTRLIQWLLISLSREKFTPWKHVKPEHYNNQKVKIK